MKMIPRKSAPVLLLSYKIPTCFFLILTFALQGYAGPKLNWVYVSTGHIWDHWESTSGSVKWHTKERFKKNLNSLSAGARVSFSPKYSLTLSLPVFFNTQAPYTSSEPVYLNDNSEPLGTFELESPTLYSLGLGDIKITQSLKFKSYFTSLTIGVPSGYKTNDSIKVDYNNWQNGGAAYFNAPWTGFGAYTLKPGLVYASTKHYLWFSPTFVIYSPQNKGLVDAGDFSLPLGYTHTYKISKKFKLKGHLLGAYKSFHWSDGQEHRVDLDITPGFGISFLPRWNQELSLNIYGTYWSESRQKRGLESNYTDVQTPKKISLGIYYGRYF